MHRIMVLVDRDESCYQHIALKFCRAVSFWVVLGASLSSIVQVDASEYAASTIVQYCRAVGYSHVVPALAQQSLVQPGAVKSWPRIALLGFLFTNSKSVLLY